MPMTVTQMILLVLAIIAIVWGIVTLVGALKKKKHPENKPVRTKMLSSTPVDSAVNQQTGKNGLPIVPRHERVPVEHESTFKAEITPDNPDGSVELSAANTDFEYPQSSTQTHSGQAPSGSSHLAFTSATVEPDNEPDAFSLLADATEHIRPPVTTYDESQLREQFTDNSPVVDGHIQSQIDHDQNSPLNHAEQNVSVFLYPNQPNARIAGRDLLQLFDVYGLKYGAMNMFHRYEGKDGTGILWFSVMMVGDQDIEAFDLNRLPMQSVNGLALFLSLPHPKAAQGFDSMISIAGLMAHALQASLYDENNMPLTKEQIHRMREIAVNFA